MDKIVVRKLEPVTTSTTADCSVSAA